MKKYLFLTLATLLCLSPVALADGFALFRDPAVKDYKLTMDKVSAYERFFKDLSQALQKDQAIQAEQKAVEAGDSAPETIKAMVEILKKSGPKTLALGEKSGLTADEVLVVPLLLATIEMNNMRATLSPKAQESLPTLSETNANFAKANETALKDIASRIGLGSQ